MSGRYDCSIAGFGVVSALGAGIEATRRNMAAGYTGGMRKISLPGMDADTFFGFTGLKGVDAITDCALAQIDESVADLLKETNPRSVAVVVGTSNSTMEEFTDNPTRIDMAHPAERVRERYSLKGPCYAVSTACSSSAKVFASARRLLKSGIVDAVIAGGADAFARTVTAGFASLESLDSELTRPLCADRKGINLGEGAAFFVMRRGRGKINLIGTGESSDAHHPTAPDPEGKGAEASMRMALADAHIDAAEVDYVNLHGTGTVYNDAMECAAVRRVFGERVACSSTKPMTGHCLGAAGAIEIALCCIALESGRGCPPQVALPVDPQLAPFDIPQTGDCRTVRTVLSNNFAFGGSNAAVILQRG